MILITGVTGLVGAHLALEFVKQNKPIKALKRTTSDLNKVLRLFQLYETNGAELFEKITWIEGDVCDVFSLQDALEGVTEVYHCAGFISFDKKDASLMHKINAEGTANMVNVSLEKGVRAFCYVSSIATLENSDIVGTIDEKVYWKSSPTNSDYAISKYNGEREVWRGSEEGLPIVIVNPGVIIGPGFWSQGSGEMINKGRHGFKVYTEGITGYVDVRDVVNSMLWLITNKQYGQRFVLIENNYSFKTIFTYINQSFGKPSPSININRTLLRLGQLGDYLIHLVSGKKRVVTSDIAQAALEKKHFSNQKIKNIYPTPFTPIKETIAFCCKYYITHHS